MRHLSKRILFSIVFSLFLLAAVGATTFVALKRQDIRQRAANDVEFMQVTPADRRKGGKGQVAVVLSKLDPKYEYRLIFGLAYDKNPNIVGIDESQKPESRDKTVRVKENKTYKFKFRAEDCRFPAKLDIQLYYREGKEIAQAGVKREWKPVDAPTAVGNTKLEYSCDVKVITPPAQPTPESTESASVAPASEPSPEITQPGEGGLPDPDPEAQEIEDMEDDDVLEKESEDTSAPSQSSANPTPLPTLAASPNPTSAPAQTPRVTPRATPHVSPSTTPRATPRATPQASPNPSPSTVTTSSPFPTSTPTNNQQPTTYNPLPATIPENRGSFGDLLAQTPTNPAPSTAALTSADPTPTPTNQFVSSPTPQPSASTVATTPVVQLPIQPTPAPFGLPAGTKLTLPLIIMGIGAVIATGVGIILLL